MAEQQAGLTPRPWRAVLGRSMQPQPFHKALVAIFSDGASVVHRDPDHGVSESESRANARATAALPDLLAAAEGVVDWCRPGCSFCSKRKSTQSHRAGCPYPALEAAIEATHAH